MKPKGHDSKSKSHARKTRFRTRRALLGVIALSIFGGGVASGQDLAAQAAFECPITPREDRLPSVVAAMAGRYPVWMVHASIDRWHGPETPHKTLWVIARDHPGDLRITGRRLDGKGQARFKVGMEMPVVPELFFPNVHKIKVVPGGSSQEIIDTYSFRTSGVVYPSPGCWELTARIGETAVQIVLKLQ